MESSIPAVDHVSGIPLRDLAFILSRFFLSTLFFNNLTIIDHENSRSRAGHFEIINCGSVPEGFALPVYVQVRADESNVIIVDNDYLWVDRRYKVIKDIGMRSRKKANKIALVLDNNGSREGFVRLRTETGDYFRFPEYFMNKLHVRSGGYRTERQGPAVKIHVDDNSPKTSIDAQENGHSVDFVYALEYDQWPEAAAEWRIRERLGGWPSLDLIAALPLKGCHLVQKAHHESSQPYVEWRLSFSKIEVVLARSLSNVQKKCYILFKLAVSFILKIDKSAINQQALSTYHLKTVMFWTYERIPASEFTEITIGERYLDLLDRLIDFLDKRFLPNYFVRQNNMISHIRRKNRQAIVKKLLWLRKYPISAFIQFETEYYFLISDKDYKENVFLVFQELFYPVAHDKLIELYMAQGYTLKDFLVLFQLKFRYSRRKINISNRLHAALSDPIMQLLQIVDPSVEYFMEFFAKISYIIIPPSRFRSSLARHFLERRLHVERELTKSQSEIWTKRIHQTFHQAMNTNLGTSVKDVLDYYSWLIFDLRMSQFERDFDFLQELKTHLGDVMVFPKLVQFDHVNFVTYTTADKYMIHDPLLRKELEDIGQITVPTKIYLYYLLVARKVMSYGINSPKTQRSVVEMKQVCGEYGYTDETYVRYSALGYGCTYTDSGKLLDVTVANMCYNFDSELSDFPIHT